MKLKRYNFTKQFIESLAVPNKGSRDYYKDSKVFGLELMVTNTGAKSFSVRRKKNSKTIRVALGRYPEVSIENAKNLAFIAKSV